MVYKNISIKNIRGIKSCEIEGLSRVNIFLGKNNCGKSSLLESIFLLTGNSNPRLIVNIDLFRNLGHTQSDDFRFLFYKLNYSNHVIIESKNFNDDGFRRVTISPMTENKSALEKDIVKSAINSIITTDSFFQEEAVNGLRMFGEVKKKNSQTKKFETFIDMNYDLNGTRSFQLKGRINISNEIKAIFQHSNSTTANDIFTRLETLLIAKKKKDLIEALQNVDESVQDIILGSNNVIYFDCSADKYIPSNLMGDGFLKLLNIYVNIEEVKNGILLIDEIDNGLHFSVLKTLWKLILKSAKQYNVQLFCTTHSSETLVKLNEVIQEELGNEDYSKDIAYFNLIKDKNGNIKALRYDYNKAEFSFDHNLEIR